MENYRPERQSNIARHNHWTSQFGAAGLEEKISGPSIFSLAT
jgi:hypothetical protein